MARKIALLAIVITCGSCMKMRETVERRVMVRTTGSDLQPEATGFIYKKESDGPMSVIKMEEDEVMEHLSKLYDEPKAYAAPVPSAKGPFHKNEDDEKASSLSSEARVIPVIEKPEENKQDDHLDGIADDEDYRKGYDKYASEFDDYKSFLDYLKGLGHFDYGIYHDKNDGKQYNKDGHHKYGGNGYKAYGRKYYYAKGDDEDYHKGHHDGHAASDEGDHKKEYDGTDAYGKHYAHGHGYKGGDHGHKAADSKEDALDGFRKIYDKDEHKKDHDFYDAKGHKNDFYKYSGGHADHGSEAGGFKKGGVHESGLHKNGFGKSGFYDKESGESDGEEQSSEDNGESSHHSHGDTGDKEGKFGVKSYSFQIKH